MIGSNACGTDWTKYEGTIKEQESLFREILKLGYGDFVMVSGNILTVKEPEPGLSLLDYRYFPPGSYCTEEPAAKAQGVLVVRLDSMFKMVPEIGHALTAAKH
jgi:hypothetical protein